ncbi:flagellar motor protein MotB [Niveispirillum fermenti]|uniref:flagellar motor protein MotB n=1 Tax=Niveispirillum fermenti TaxID=1233113 RepID=UPI003A8B1901
MAISGRLTRTSIIIRRRHAEEEEEHGNGSWKIAYADFTTMMMAFFMLLWLVNITSPEQKEGIADYFNPISVSSSNSGADGQLSGQSVAESGSLTSSASSAWETIPAARVPALSPPGPDPQMREGEPGQERGQPAGQDGAQGDLALGEVAGGDIPAGPTIDPGLAEQMARVAMEQAAFERIEAELRAILADGGELSGLSESLLFDITPEGLRIQITDRPHFSMFDVGSIDLNGRAAALLRVVAQALAPVPNPVAVAGHTDGRAFAATARYGNWELSSDRANAARRLLAAHGIAPSRLARVEGLADTLHLFPAAPQDPRNRRISIILLRQVPLPTGAAPQ